MRRFLLSALALTCISVPASANLYTNDFGSLVPGYFANDDNTFGPVALPFTFNYFGGAYNTATVSNNGNVQFGTDSGSFSPDPLNTSTTIRAIAPWWTDLDSRSDPLGAIVAGTGGSAIYVSTPTANQIVFTWDRLGYFSQDYVNRVLFQLVLNNPNAPIAPGEAQIGFYYGSVGPQASRDVTIGFGDGLSDVNPGEISLFAGQTSDATNFIQSGPGYYLFNISGGVITEVNVPEPGTLGLLGLGLAGLGVASRRRRKAG